MAITWNDTQTKASSGGIKWDGANTPSVIPQKAPQPPQQSFSDSLWSALSGAGKQVGNAFQGGVDQAKQGYQQATQATNPLTKTEAGLQEVGGAVSAIASPLAPVFAPVSKAIGAAGDALSNNSLIKGAAGNQVVDANGMTSYKPNMDANRVPQDINNTANLLPLAAGALSPKQVGSEIQRTAANIKNTGGKLKDSVLGTPEEQAAKKTVTQQKNQQESLKTSINDVMPFQNKEVRIDELRNTFPDSNTGKGGVAREGVLGKSTPQPTAEDIQRGTVANEYIAGVKDPVAKIANINQGIKTTSSGVDTFLDKNSAPSNFADMRSYMETNQPKPSLQKDPAAFESYNRATQGALDTLYKTMKDSAKRTGDFGAQTSGADIRAARIAIDQQISKELGENVFGTPQYKGIKAAEIDTRNLLNRLSEDLLRYPGQLENLNKMNEFISQAKARGVEVDLTDPNVKAQIESSFGLKSTAASDANAEFLKSQHKKMSYLYDARDNLIDKYQSSVGKNRVQEAIKNHPIVAGVAKKAATLVGVGEAVKFGGL